MPNENDNKLVTLADLAEVYNALYNRDVTTTATQSANGLMSSSDKIKLDGIAAGAQVTSVNNQTGAVSITPENIGAVAKSGDTMTGALTAPCMVAKSDDWRFYSMQDANGSDMASMRSDQQTHHIVLREMTPGTNSAYEDYSLPIPTIQSSGIGYDILTTKSPVTIPQGGTGATTPAGARANLGLNDIGTIQAQPTVTPVNDAQMHQISVTTDCWVCASFHVTANTNGSVIVTRNGTPVIYNVDSDGACNYWTNAQFPCPAGATLQYILVSNATDSCIYFRTV